MSGLIDYIFHNINIAELDRSEVISYSKYISEIFQSNLSVEQKVRFQRIEVLLQKRLKELERTQKLKT